MNVHHIEQRAAVLHVATPKGKPIPVAIPLLFSQWLALREELSDEGEDEAEARFKLYTRLQRRITAMRPASATEAAMQLLVETDDGESDWREAFFSRVRRLAMEGVL